MWSLVKAGSGTPHGDPARRRNESFVCITVSLAAPTVYNVFLYTHVLYCFQCGSCELPLYCVSLCVVLQVTVSLWSLTKLSLCPVCLKDQDSDLRSAWI